MGALPVVLVIGATGATGVAIIKGLADLNTSHIVALVCPSTSTNTPSRLNTLRALGVEIRTGTTHDSPDAIRKWLKGVDVVVTTVVMTELFSQREVVMIAKEVGVKRFVPSDFGPYCPPGIMLLQDKKNLVRKFIVDSGIGYTFIDTDSWLHVVLMEIDGTFPYGTHAFPPPDPTTFTVVGSGNVAYSLTHIDDAGALVARIVLDERTLNKVVYCMGERITQNQAGKIYEEETKKKLTWTATDADALLTRYTALHASLPLIESDPPISNELILTDYAVSRWIRGDNKAPRGALKSWELYPEYKCEEWRDWLREAVTQGSVVGAR